VEAKSFQPSEAPGITADDNFLLSRRVNYRNLLSRPATTGFRPFSYPFRGIALSGRENEDRSAQDLAYFAHALYREKNEAVRPELK
jgi:hypothetical protein